MKAEAFSNNFYAAGLNGLPERITVKGKDFQLWQVLKNDFFAVTGIYLIDPQQANSAPPKVVLKMARCRSFFGLPLKWLGKLMCRHEMRMLALVKEIPNVPQIYSPYGKYGFVYNYIPGNTLDDRPCLDPAFFDELRDLLKKIHQRNIAYIDMNKRGNIIVGEDGKPRLIDFQISRHIKTSPILPALSHYIRKHLQHADIYHLCKHKRKFQPHLLTSDELATYKNRPGWIKAHRLIANPYRTIRRSILRFLHKKCFLIPDKNANPTPETDPDRYLK
ncbi:serine/threonine protein kinase [Anaerohalosphaera lusitana]|uniref:Serine/threonine protein kinase n=1 Tax=Anaerohalosphaera lusitana TaxID=1936003 RepID=A0A1U9NPZ3_9BACT|nr:hypothetical protein [Anaerohalosphaera lusitana]AQT69680.1 serine/threonine protein kinase [Anaerohalosphaera lusitana]